MIAPADLDADGRIRDFELGTEDEHGDLARMSQSFLAGSAEQVDDRDIEVFRDDGKHLLGGGGSLSGRGREALQHLFHEFHRRRDVPELAVGHDFHQSAF